MNPLSGLTLALPDGIGPIDWTPLCTTGKTRTTKSTTGDFEREAKEREKREAEERAKLEAELEAERAEYEDIEKRLGVDGLE
jgi:hypothetical protein